MSQEFQLMKPNLNQLKELVSNIGRDRVDDGISSQFAEIGKLLLEEATTANLDRDVYNLQLYARAVGCELISSDVREKFFFKHDWARLKLAMRAHGKDGAHSDVRAPEKQRTLLTIALLTVMKQDSNFKESAAALLKFSETSKLWTDEDAIDRD